MRRLAPRAFGSSQIAAIAEGGLDPALLRLRKCVPSSLGLS